MIPKSTLQTTVGLLVLGIVMVLTLIIFAFSILSGNAQQPIGNPNGTVTVDASPTPEYEEFVIPNDGERP